MGEKTICPSFFKFQKSGRGQIWEVVFCPVYNHHQQNQLSMSKEHLAKVKEILLTKLDDIIHILNPNYSVIRDKVRNELISMGANKDAVYAIITRKYISSRLWTLSNEFEKKTSSSIKFLNLLPSTQKDCMDLTILIILK